jgi:hypothetical protein
MDMENDIHIKFYTNLDMDMNMDIYSVIRPSKWT